VSEEIQYIKGGIDQLGKNLDVKISYIMLSKKVNAKLFFYDKNKDSYDNCVPGTVVDENIVNHELNDFYLISQKSTQGVSQPTHYYIAYDDQKINPADLYSLIYKMSYLYYNWNGSVRTPAPYMYAKKMVRLIGEKLSDKNGVVKPSKDFETKFKTLYFL
jgi:aubergine-like protein